MTERTSRSGLLGQRPSRKWAIPAPLDLDWAMRERSSADITRRILPDGRLEQVIRHAVLPDITPESIVWWFQVIDRTVEFRGIRCLAYRLWHPRDHIHFEVHGRRADGSVGPGARFRIVEAFGARPEFLVDEVFRVTKLDLTGFSIELWKAGRLLLSLVEDLEPVEGGLRYTVTMRAGLTGMGRWLNPILRRREAAKLEAWLAHNVEEVGNFPRFLPELYAEAQRPRDPSGLDVAGTSSAGQAVEQLPGRPPGGDGPLSRRGGSAIRAARR